MEDSAFCKRCKAIIDCCDSLITVLDYSKNKASMLLGCKSTTSSLLNGTGFGNERYEMSLHEQLSAVEESLTRMVIKYSLENTVILTEKTKKSLFKVPCLPSERGPFIMKYLYGQCHTDFWLTFVHEENSYTPLNELRAMLRLKFDMLESLDRFSEERPAKRGDHVYAVSEDNTYLFRGMVLQCSSCIEQVDKAGQVEVLNVDTAVTTTINLSRIFKIDEEGCLIHMQALRCCLNEDVENNCTMQWIMDVLQNYKLTVVIKDELATTTTRVEKKHSVQIDGYNQQYGLSLNFNELVKQQQYNRTTKTVHLNNLYDGLAHSLNLNDYYEQVKYPVSLLSPGQCLKGLVTYVQSPDNFYVHFMENTEKRLRCLQDEMQKYYEKLEIDLLPFMKAIMGRSNTSFCACKWNGIWYRGKISVIHEASSTVSVHLIDYGNTETMSLNTIRPLIKQFTKLTVIAQLCHMADVAPINNNNNGNGWPNKTNECFKSLIISSVIYDIVVVPSHQTIANKNSLAVLLVDSRPCFHPAVILSDILISKQLAIERVQSAGNIGHSCILYKQKMYTRETVLPKVGSLIKIQVMHIQSLSCIFVHIINDQFTGNREPFELFASKMNWPANLKKMNKLLTIPEIEQLVCVRHDDYWYRAQVVSHTQHNIKVKFVDYGCEKIVTLDSVIDIPAEYLVFPFQAVECGIEGISFENKHEPESSIIALMEQSMLHKKFDAIVKDCNNGKLLICLDTDTTLGNLDTLSNIKVLCKSH